MDSCEHAQTSRCKWGKQTFVLPSQRCNLVEEAELLRGRSEFGVLIGRQCTSSGLCNMLRLGRKQCSECCALVKYRGNEAGRAKSRKVRSWKSSCRHGMHVWSCDLAE
jgi:hypothetical protein